MVCGSSTVSLASGVSRCSTAAGIESLSSTQMTSRDAAGTNLPDEESTFSFRLRLSLKKRGERARPNVIRDLQRTELVFVAQRCENVVDV